MGLWTRFLERRVPLIGIVRSHKARYDLYLTVRPRPCTAVGSRTGPCMYLYTRSNNEFFFSRFYEVPEWKLLSHYFLSGLKGMTAPINLCGHPYGF